MARWPTGSNRWTRRHTPRLSILPGRQFHLCNQPFVPSVLQCDRAAMRVDCAHLTENPRPKAGVYAVREAPILFQNLRAALGAGTMRRYEPQKDYLKLISLGGKSALGERLGTSFSGSLMWKWKNHIDQSFMNKFRDLPQMKPTGLAPPARGWFDRGSGRQADVRRLRG